MVEFCVKRKPATPTLSVTTNEVMGTVREEELAGMTNPVMTGAMVSAAAPG